MNKRVLLGMTLMASLAFYSCTKEVVIVQEGGEGGIETPTAQDGQVLTLQVANTGDGLTSRAGRPLLSSQAKQDIDHIVLYVVCTDATQSEKKGKVVLKKTISPNEWANALDYSNTSAHGKQLQITFRKSDKQDLAGDADGITYDIYAVGYKKGNNYSFVHTDGSVIDANLGISGTLPTNTETGLPVSFTENNFVAKLTDDVNSAADEIFAGKVAVKVVTKDATTSYIIASDGNADTKVVPALVLNRQVVGVTGYFTNLPAKVGEQIPTKIRLVASGKSNQVHFTSMVSGETDNNTEAASKNVVNGSAGTFASLATYSYLNGKKGYLVYEIDLSKFFPIGKQHKDVFGGDETRTLTFADFDLDNDNFVGYKDAQAWVYRGQSVTIEDRDWSSDIQGGQKIADGSGDTEENKTRALSTFWKNPNEKTQTLVAGSVFAGEFIIPFLQKTGYNTFELQLLDKDDNILKTWNVQVPSNQIVSSENGSLAAGISGSAWSADVSTLIYNIYRNHLYSLGMKTNDIEDGGEPGTTDPDPKPEPDPDPNPEDKPEDLSKGQDLLINVNDNWEVIHKMEID
mgnify:CR=1 FL=1